MSVSNADVIDAAAADGGTLVLMISDHLRWDTEEVAHLKILQSKLNTYIRYISSGEYKSLFPGKIFFSYRIEIDFLHQYPGSFVKMLELVRDELDSRNISVEYYVEEEK